MKKAITLFLALALGFGLKAQTGLTQAVDFTATDIHGNEVHLFDILDNGQYVLIDFFFTTCSGCIQSIPYMVQSYPLFGCNQHDVFYVEVDYGDSEAQCLNWVNTYGVEYPTIAGTSGGTGICNQYGINAFPTVILIAPNHQIVIQDLWPINNVQNIVTALEAQGVEQHECGEVPAGDLVITPDTLWYSQMGEDRLFTILNETEEAVTIEDVVVEAGSNLNIWEPLFPLILEAGESVDVLVGLQTPPAKDDYSSYVINVLTSVGERQVVAMVANTALDLGLIIPGSPYVMLNEENPILNLYVANGNMGTMTPIEITSIEEGMSEGGPYLNIEPTTELPYALSAGEEFHFTITPLGNSAKSTASTSVNINYDGGTVSFLVEIDGELLDITELSNNLNLFPNPANESVTLKGENLGKVRVFNAIGQKVDEFEANGNELHFGTAHYGNGVYYIKAGETVMKLVVKH